MLCFRAIIPDRGNVHDYEEDMEEGTSELTRNLKRRSKVTDWTTTQIVEKFLMRALRLIKGDQRNLNKVTDTGVSPPSSWPRSSSGEAVWAQEQNSPFRRASEIHQFHIMKIEFASWKRNSWQQFLATNRLNYVKKVATLRGNSKFEVFRGR